MDLPAPSYRSHQQNERTSAFDELEKKIKLFQDGGHRDDLKLKMLQEIWIGLENHFTASTHEKLVEKLVLSFLGIFCNTSPQFIAENNTQQLRKLMLEIILRLSNVEAIKLHSREIIKQMMRLIAVENEDNACLAIKIVTDQGRSTGKLQYSPEVAAIMQSFKNMVIDLTASGRTVEMFLNKDYQVPPSSSSDEQLITEYLKTCYYAQTVLLNGQDGKGPLKYNMIPSAHQSVKVLLEVPYLVVYFYQHFKTSVQTEALDFMRLGFDFLNVPAPRDPALSLNQGIGDDFVSAQSKFLSFVNIMAKIPAFMDLIMQNAPLLVTGSMQLLERCPADLITVRREVLMALKYFTSGDLKTKFFPMLPRLISEQIVLGTGFTAIDHLRVFMYQMLADLLHHMRHVINFEMMTHVTFVFCRALHDPTNNAQVHTMATRLLNSLAESLCKMDETETTRDLLMEILDTHVMKLKVIAVYHMPILFQQYGTEIDYEYKSYERDSEKPGTNIPKETIKGVPKRRLRKLSIDSVEELEYPLAEPSYSSSAGPARIGEKESKLPPPTKDSSKWNSPEAILNNMAAVPSPPLTLSDCRNLVKHIMHTCKFVTGQLRVCRPPREMYHCARERDMFERLLRYGVMCMDVFVLPLSRNQPQAPSSMRTKDEKETLESLANVFTTIDHAVFREIFEKYMDFLIERIYNRNYPLQLMVNTFLVRNEVPFFASTMLSFLMSRMKLLENSNDKTTLYVKLFKIIFSAIGANNSTLHHDKMLTSYLPEILKQSTVLALTAREPLNYFLLLRSLFRSIGGGAQDILYGKFLQLLPNLLQFLNKLTSCQHRVQMRELFVELCLTVPVRLSSLLPYLPLLMDPLVCSMYGSPNIVTQGLRTLELCVDNLQPEYLLENMLPVRGALMQGLWRVIAKAPDSQSTMAAFRILGKFGGANRKLLNQPQILKSIRQADVVQSYLNMEFSRMGQDGNHSIQMPVSDILKIAADQMRYPADMVTTPLPCAPPSIHMKKWCMELSKAVLLAGLGSTGSGVAPHLGLRKILETMLKDWNPNSRPSEVYICSRESDRELYMNALLAMAYGIWNKDGFRHTYSRFFVKVLRQLTLIGVIEYVGGNNWIRQAEEEGVIGLCLDSSIIVDALVTCLSETSNSFVYAGVMCLRHINETISVALPDIQYMSKVPLCRYLMERVIRLCYGPAWYARSGGITALVYMIESFPRKFVMDFVCDIVDAIVEVIIGTIEEISSGSPESALDCMKKMMRLYFIEEPDNEGNLALATIFVAALAKHTFSNSERVRGFMYELLKYCMKESYLDNTLEKFLLRFKVFFEPEIIRIVTTAPTMALTDAAGSFAGLYTYMIVSPTGFEFENDMYLYKRFIAHLLDVAQTDTMTLSQRTRFKKCETCPSHFLPPYPVTTTIDAMRLAALRCLITFYDRMKQQYDAKGDEEMDVELTEEAMVEVLALNSEKITVEQVFENKETWRRMMVVLLRADTCLDAPDISPKLHAALMKVAPIPTDIIAAFGAPHIRSINRTDEQSKNDEDGPIPFSDIAKFKCLVELNPKILGRSMAQNLVEQVVRWKLSDKISKVLSLGRDASDEEIEAFELEKLKGVRELDMIGFTVKMLAAAPASTLTDKMVIDMARFAAHFEYTYSQDVLVNWIDDLAVLISKAPLEVWKFFLSHDSVLDPARRSLIRRLVVYESSEPLRQAFMDNPELLDKLLDGESDTWKDDNDETTWDREMYALSIVDRISRQNQEWLISPLSPIAKLKEVYSNVDFVQRYVVRSLTGDDTKEIKVRNMTEHKYKVPKLIINIFLRYLRLNIYDYQLFFDVVSVFIGNYVTDFCFVREYLETEVIPAMPLAWRREIFIQVMVMFETDAEKTATDLRVVKALQYIVIPSLQWAFERYDTDEIVGTAPIDDSETSIDQDSSANMDNLVGRLAAVIDAHRQKLSDGMVIVFYQLCTLFVQHASEHIHNNNCKKQGGRLRIFMLFAWPCLTLANHQDPTMRFTGFYFLSNIIERFTINKKIVLQVFQCLTTTYQQDTRDQIRKAIDILTPAVKTRMEDGHQQILSNVKKVLIEECHTLQHVQHIFQMVTRNYRVYYHVRHELLTPLLNAVQRALIMPNSVHENWATRRHAIDICEMVIKWELFKILRADHVITDEEAFEVDKQLDKLRSSSSSSEKFEFEEGTVNKRDLTDSQRTICKDHVDTVVNMLTRFCMTIHQNCGSGNGQSQGPELIKKSQLLLRAALRPSVWGEFATIRTSTIEKYLTIQQEQSLRHEGNLQIWQNQCLNSQHTLDMLCVLVMVMPKTNMLAMMRPLQRPIISCLQSGSQQNFKVNRHVTQIVSRLLEKTNVTPAGLVELEILNQFIAKYLNEQFTSLLKTLNGAVLGILGAFSLLRTICTHEPAYMDQVLPSFVKVMERAAKEHVSYVSNSQDGSIMKNVAELLCVCMDLVRPRLDHMSTDIKRTMVSSVLTDMIGKTNHDKILLCSTKLLGAMLTPNDLDFTIQIVIPHLVRIQTMIVGKFKNSKDLIADFLVVILKVFERTEYRNTEAAQKLWDGFFWGLKSGDPQTRENFACVWEMTWTPGATIDLVQRMKFIIRNQDWTKFNKSFWLKYALWGLLRTVARRPNANSRRKKVMMLNCASPWRTIEYAARLKEFPMEMALQPQPRPEKQEEPEAYDDLMKDPAKNPLTMDQLFQEQQELFEEAAGYDFANVLDTVSHIMFGLNDNKVTSRMWTVIFKSFWASLTHPELEEMTSLLVPFLSSGAHNGYVGGVGQESVMPVLLEAAGEAMPLPSRLVEFLAIKHECWHLGIKLLESVIWTIPKQLNNDLLRNMSVPPLLSADIETLESLSALYSEINEFDQFAAIWERRSVFPDTMRAMSAMQLGDMEHAAMLLENTMATGLDTLQAFPRKAVASGGPAPPNAELHVSPIIDKEYDHWMDMYIASCSELLQWQAVADVCNSKDMQHVRGLITAASHIPDWAVVEECKNQIAGCVPPNFHLEYTVFNLMTNVMRIVENGIPGHYKDRCKVVLTECMDAHIQKWRTLPPIVTYSHVKILQAMNLIREIEESIDIRLSLLDPPNKFDQALMTDMKALMKVFRNRGPTASDDMGFVSSWYDWRNQIHGMMLQRFDAWDRLGLNVSSGNQSIVPIHSMAQAQLTEAKHAKNLGFHNLSKDLLNKLAGLTAIPMMDANDKVCTYGKTLRDMAMLTSDEKLRTELLYEALEVLEDFRIDDLQRDQVATLLYHRANVHSVLDQTHNADTTFSAAAQLIDMSGVLSGPGMKLMKNWGHHLYKRFFSTTVCKETGNTTGRQALSCYFMAARIDNDIKARKPIAKILWLAKHLSVCGSNEALNRVIKQQLYAVNIYNWLYWLPQLVTEVRHKPTSNFVLILLKIAAAHPLQVFYYCREAVAPEYIDTVLQEDYTEEEMSHDVPVEATFPNDEPFARIIKTCLKYRPTDIRVYHRIMKELDDMAEVWVEKHLRYAIALKDQLFDDFSEQMDAHFNEMNFSAAAKNIASLWKTELQEDLKYFQENYHLDYLQIRNRRKVIVGSGFMGNAKSRLMFEKEMSQAFMDPPDMEDEFTFVSSFVNSALPHLDIHLPQATRPPIYIRTALHWVKMLRHRFDRLPKRAPMDISAPFLARYSHRSACIEMPYDLLNVLRAKNSNQLVFNQTGQYISMISRFEPIFEICVKGSQVMRKIYLRGQTGKSVAFYLKKSVLPEPTNRVPQLFKHIDYVLQTDRESARRHLNAPMLTQMRVGTHTTLIEVASVQPYAMPDNCARNYPSSQIDILHPYDVLTATFGSYTPDDMVLHFFDRFAQSASSIGQPLPNSTHHPDQQPGPMGAPIPHPQLPPRITESHHIKNIIYEDFARDVIPFRLLFDYLISRYPDPVMYFSMRKQFLHSLAVNSIIEYHCNLTPLGPHQMVLAMNTGVLSNPWYRFELAKGRSLQEIQHFGHEVPFRLTPNLSILVGVAQDGDLLWSMAAASKCLMKKDPEVVMRPLLWDEYANNVDSENMVYVCHASNSYVNGVTNKLRATNSPDAKLKKDDCVSLISRAKDSDNLARMPPTYHAWF